MKVFLVEDSAAIRDHVRATVSEVAGAEVVAEAETESAAIEGICRTRPDAVILDLTLPRGSGIEVLRCTKQLLPDVRFIILTNKADLQYRKKCMALGADYFLDKSREFGSLGRHLRDLSDG
ncbi:MAG TPA: response regulator transcription factor [Noviherbaspirillum sp.]